jgi:hypothetical protein
MLKCSTAEVCLSPPNHLHQAYTTCRHQVDALGFMTDRELSRLHDAKRYWRSGMDEDGTEVYVLPRDFATLKCLTETGTAIQ